MTFFIRRRSPLLAAAAAMAVALPNQPSRAQQTRDVQDPPGDARVQEAIEDELLFDLAVPSRRIDVQASDGIVTLAGTTDNLLASERAVAIARTVRGVRAVVDRIDVEPAEGQTLAELREAVEQALLTDPATDAYEVRAVVSPGGKVDLEGRAESWAERQLCEKVAKSVEGVTAVENSIALHYATRRADTEIVADIERCLYWDILVDDGLIDVACDQGKVTLSGTVGSATERIRARRTAWVAGVDEVDIDNLQVARWARDEAMRGSKYAVRSDEQVREAVTDALRRDPRVAGFEVDVEARQGRVVLRGTVDNLKARRAAADDARNTVGVSRVVNRLRVEPKDPRSSSAIAASVRQALQREPYVDSDEVTVLVENGVASLYGRVDSNFERACADDAASRVVGVVEVQNLLAVRDASMVAFDPYVDPTPIHRYSWYRYGLWHSFDSDEEIAQRLAAELWWSPFVDGDAVEIEVDDGVVTLTGHAASETANLAAVENAYDAGAVWVVDRLTIGTPDREGAAPQSASAGRSQ